MVAVIVSYVAVEKVIVLPAHHSRVRPNAVEAALNVMWGDRVKSTAYVCPKKQQGNASRCRYDVLRNP